MDFNLKIGVQFFSNGCVILDMELKFFWTTVYSSVRHLPDTLKEKSSVTVYRLQLEVGLKMKGKEEIIQKK